MPLWVIFVKITYELCGTHGEVYCCKGEIRLALQHFNVCTWWMDACAQSFELLWKIQCMDAIWNFYVCYIFYSRREDNASYIMHLFCYGLWIQGYILWCSKLSYYAYKTKRVGLAKAIFVGWTYGRRHFNCKIILLKITELQIYYKCIYHIVGVFRRSFIEEQAAN